MRIRRAPHPRAALLAGLLAALAGGCNGEKAGAPLEIFTGNPPEVRTRLELGESRLGAQAFYFPLLVRSHAPTAVTLKLRLEEAAPKGLKVALLGEADVLRETTARPRLQIVPPDREGPWSARVTLFADQLPDWSYEWFVTGEVVRRAPTGAFLSVDPPGLDLGRVREGTRVPVTFQLASAGSDPIRVLGWQTEDSDMLELPAVPAGGVPLESGKPWKLEAAIVAPSAPGPFRAAILLRTDSAQTPLRRILIEGVVQTEYVLEPTALDMGPVFPGNPPQAVLAIRHESGEKSFFVDSVTGQEKWLEVVDDGGKEPATSKRLIFRLRSDAPRGRARFTVKLGLLPEPRTIDWNVSLVVVPSIVADPQQLDFGQVPANQPTNRDVVLHSFSGHAYRVTAVRAEKSFFLPDAVERPDGGWLIRVHLRPGLSRGVPYLDRIWVETDDPDTPKLLIDAFVQLR